ncbi:MAG: serine hydrolase [Nitrospirae bacterium]|nr:serine hydrolase [Nitrospirota bacterium]
MRRLYIKALSKASVVRAVSVIIILVTGISLGFFLKGSLVAKENTATRHFEVREQGFKFINPLLECSSTPDASENERLRPFKNRIESLREDLLKGGWVSDIAVYFRDLNNGPWFSIQDVDCFSPSSLLKVPTMMAILKEAESNPNILSKKIKFALIDGTDLNAYQMVRPSSSLVPGEFYTVEELLHRMIVYSDNNATAILQGSINSGVLDRTYRELGIRNPYVRKDEYVMSVELCATFFRILFNASYLNKEMSEKALQYLGAAEYNNGLVAGVPSGTAVAHKFGERTVGPDNDVMQLHDCGIVYYPNHPYLLCVMTSGKSFEFLDDAIRQISMVVYGEVENQHRDTGLTPVASVAPYAF